RQGIATMLVDALGKLAGSRGAAALTVEASDTAQNFFAKRGYTAQQRNSVTINDEWLAHTTMKKTLGAPP
ncbi:GNAT family N-acetyltransferase, partial [Acinetobacter baumannii]|uniref:GNAT family N-acetyltransferase n=1 Tax=Acinetobacter baumannii TaxID=470 RepID=UPI00114721D8